MHITHIHIHVHTHTYMHRDVNEAEKILQDVLALEPNNYIGMREYAKLLFDGKNDCEAAVWMLNRLEVCMCVFI